MRRLSFRPPIALLAVAVVAAACSRGGVPGADGSTTSTTPPTSATTEVAPVLCPRTAYRAATPAREVLRLTADEPGEAAIQFSVDAFECAADVVVVRPDRLEVAALAARLAVALEGPLLFGSMAPSPALDAELARLIPQRVWLVGEDLGVAALPEGSRIEKLSGDPATLVAQVREQAGGGPVLVLPAADGAGMVAVAVQAIVEGASLDLSPPEPPTTTTTAAAEGGSSTSTTGAESGPTTSTTAAAGDAPSEEKAVPVVLAGTGDSGVAWLVDAGAPAPALAAVAAAVPSGGLMALVDGDDLRRLPEVGRALRAAPGGVPAVRLVGDITPHATWQLPVLLEGDELPGGGYLLFPGRRLVALYGHVWAASLGVLGEQRPPEAVEAARRTAAPYAEEGLVLVPAFEIIVTVAAANAGPDGNYSNETPVEDIRPWVEAAGAAGLYVILDLQPGRSDFLTQARLYEDFLRLPFVGLALDPEWRLGPGQLPLQQIGTVSAEEVNAVAEWLAGIVREERLPQKLLLLHQFRMSMIPDREGIVILPELALVIQMDGQGPLAAKYNTWAAVTAGTEQAGWSWGWKNFYDEDSPTAKPEQVLALRPSVVYVSYQ